jgi:hypothetical protein
MAVISRFIIVTAMILSNLIIPDHFPGDDVAVFKIYRPENWHGKRHENRLENRYPIVLFYYFVIKCSLSLSDAYTNTLSLSVSLSPSLSLSLSQSLSHSLSLSLSLSLSQA